MWFTLYDSIQNQFWRWDFAQFLFLVRLVYNKNTYGHFVVPMGTNPMYGPSPEALLDLGGLNADKIRTGESCKPETILNANQPFCKMRFHREDNENAQLQLNCSISRSNTLGHVDAFGMDPYCDKYCFPVTVSLYVWAGLGILENISSLLGFRNYW